MPDLEDDEFVDYDSSDNEEQHSQLLSTLSQLDSRQRVKPASRKEASSEVSEFNLNQITAEDKNLVNVKELAQVLQKKSSHVSIAAKFKKVTDKSKTLPKPLEKPVEEKIKRTIGFENVKNQLKRWDAVVARNAIKDHLKFPLNNTSMKMQSSTEFLGQFQTATPLEVELEKVLKPDKPKNEKESEADTEYPLTLEELLQKRKEMAQLRAKLSYKEAKAQRQSKIKSKKYHRILKRQKIREQIKEFELLQKTDPEAALKKLEEFDKSRAKERASLKHRNTGQWAKNLKVRAKYDIESRKVLAEQLKLSREITQKVHTLNSSDEEDDNEEVPQMTKNPSDVENLTISKNNPWSLDVSQEVANFVSDYKKYWSEKNKEVVSNHTNSVEKLVEDKSVVKTVDSSGKNESETLQEENNTPTNTDKKKKQKTKALKKSKLKSLANGDCKQPILASSDSSKQCATTSIQSTSGVWIVSPVNDLPQVNSKNSKKRKSENLEELFSDLNDKMLKKAAKRAKQIKKTIQKKEKNFPKENKKRTKEFDLTLKQNVAIERPDMDVELHEGPDDELVGDLNVSSIPSQDQNSNVVRDVNASSAPSILENSNAPPPEIDPKKFIQVKPKKLNTRLPDKLTGGDDALDDDEEIQQKIIEEAFVDDDVVDEFNEMKKEEEKNNEVEISTSLPGWGEWGGTGIVPNPRKQRRLIVKLPPRKDKKKEDLIINENENPNIKNHLVKEVPFPFKSVEAFEANIRAPVGRDWVPETAHRKLIQKEIETTLGAVIEPMDENEIVRMKKERKSPYQGKQKVKKK